VVDFMIFRSCKNRIKIQVLFWISFSFKGRIFYSRENNTAIQPSQLDLGSNEKVFAQAKICAQTISFFSSSLLVS